MTTEKEWRRRWKPTLQSRVWRPFNIGGEMYLIKSNFTHNSYGVLISNFTSVWEEELEDYEIEQRCKKLNPSVEAPLSKLLDHLRDNLEESQKGTEYSVAFKDCSTRRSEEYEKLVLTVTSKLAGLTFVWKFQGEPSSNSVAYANITEPLLSMVSELQRRQEELYKLLHNKDKEIEDYKAQGIRVTRKHLETPPFDDVAFHNNMVTSKGFESEVQQCGRSAFEKKGQELYRQIMTKQAWLRRTGNEEELEGESLMDEAGDEPVAAEGTGQSWRNRLPPSLAGASPTKSPGKSPTKSPGKGGSSKETSPVKDTELLRRQALERRLQEEEEKKEQSKAKKKKKIKF